MERGNFYGRKERMARFYNSLKNYVGDNELFKCGDVLYVSTRNNGSFDMIITADGIHRFCDLYRSKQEEGYTVVKKASALASYAGKDIRVESDEVANAFTPDMPYFKDIIISGAEISQTVTMKAEGRITLDGISVSGEKGSSNGKITFAADEVALRNITAVDGSTLYNAFEGYQRTDDPKYEGLKWLVAENLDIDCPSLTHNIINVYTPAEGAEITVKDSMFNLTVDNTNVLRMANYLNAENVSIIFDNCDWTYENGLTKNDWRWAGLLIYQPAGSDIALNGDLSKLKTWTLRFRNCRYNGVKVTENAFGEHSQVSYLYNIGNGGAVTDPTAVEGLRMIFE